MTGNVQSLRLKFQKGQMEDKPELILEAGKGIVGDFYYENDPTGKRQVLILDESTLEEFGYEDGELREQILVSFPELQKLPIGTTLRIGNSQVEIMMDCAPCRHMAESLGEDPKEFVEKMIGKRGMLGRIVKSGTVRIGDVVELVASE